MQKISIISNDENSTSLQIEGNITYDDFILMTVSAIHQMSIQSAKTMASEIHKDPTFKKRSLKELRTEILGDMADRINFAISNVLNDISPIDQDLSLSEEAIATLENIVINRAANNKTSIKEELANIEAELSQNELAAKHSSGITS